MHLALILISKFILISQFFFFLKNVIFSNRRNGRKTPFSSQRAFKVQNVWPNSCPFNTPVPPRLQILNQDFFCKDVLLYVCRRWIFSSANRVPSSVWRVSACRPHWSTGRNTDARGRRWQMTWKIWGGGGRLHMSWWNWGTQRKRTEPGQGQKKKKEGRGIIFELKKKSKLSRSRKEEKITTVNGRCQGTQMTRQGTRQIERRVKAVRVGQTAGGEDVGGGRTMGMAVAAAGPRGHIMFSWSVVLSGHPSLPLFPLIFPPLASMVPVKIPPPSSI